MDKQVLCYVDSMGFNQRVQFPDGSEEYFPTESFAETIVTACAHRDCNKIHLFGNEIFLKGLQEEMEAYHCRKYTSTILEIEVN